MIEHLEFNYLYQLLRECYRVLSNNGVLIMETPSIDNLLVSSKLFYLDSTHITHINPDGLTFSLEKIGFVKTKYYYIHGGPLQKANHLKITRILNGIAQDVLFVSAKSESASQLIFEDNYQWESHLDKGLSTLDAAIDYDEESEIINHNLLEQNEKIKLDIQRLNDEISLLKAELKYVLLLMNIIRRIFLPLLKLIRILRKYILYLFNKLFNILVNYDMLRSFLLSTNFLRAINIFLKIFFGSKTTFNISKIQNKYSDILEMSVNSKKFNQRLKTHFNNSLSAKKYFKLLKNGLKK